MNITLLIVGLLVAILISVALFLTYMSYRMMNAERSDEVEDITESEMK